MIKLIFGLLGGRLMDKAGDGGGGTGGGAGTGNGEPGTGNGGQGDTPPVQGGDNGGTGTGDGATDGGAQTTQGGEGGQGGTQQTQGDQGGDKPFLGNQPQPPAEPGSGKPGTGDGNKPPINAPDEKAYLDAVKKDEAVFGKNDALVFDQRLVKSVVPVCQKHGISPEVANELANAFAKAQFDGAREAYKERCDYFAKMNGEARAKYTDSDFEQINRGIDKYFKPGGIMNNVIRNSELGADPEFLALMHELGAGAVEDTGKGAAAGGGSGTGDPNGIDGLSKMW